MVKVKNLSGRYITTPREQGLLRTIFLPDYSPGRGKLQTGTVAIFDRKKHSIDSSYLGSDIGCGMSFFHFNLDFADVPSFVEEVSGKLEKKKRGTLGNLGGGNHFVDFFLLEEGKLSNDLDNKLFGVVHSGNGRFGQEIVSEDMNEKEYLKAYKEAYNFSQANRDVIVDMVSSTLHRKVDYMIKNKTHNDLELNNGCVIYRKGAVRLDEGDQTIIPSSMDGPMVLVEGTKNLEDLDWSMSHGTGRKMSRSDAKKLPQDMKKLRKRIYVPSNISDASLRQNSSEGYRTLNDVLSLLKDYVVVRATFHPIAHIGKI